MKNKLFNLIIITVCLFLIVNLSRSILELWGSGGRVEVAQKELETVQGKNLELKRKLVQVQSPQYLERIARNNLGLAKEGETVVILPPVSEAIDLKIKEEIPNWQKWLKIFFD